MPISRIYSWHHDSYLSNHFVLLLLLTQGNRMSNITFVFWHFQSRNNCFINILFPICIMRMKSSFFWKKEEHIAVAHNHNILDMWRPSGIWKIQISVSALLFINTKKHSSNKIFSNTKIKFIRYHSGPAKLHSAEMIDFQNAKKTGRH